MLHYKFLTLLIFVSVFVGCYATGYSGFKYYEVIPATREQCYLLFELSQRTDLYDFKTLSKAPKIPARVIVNANEIDNFLAYLEKHNFKEVKVLDENVGKTIELEFNKNRLLRTLKSNFTGKGRLSTERYYTHQEVNDYIEDIANRFPKQAHVKTVGKSFEGRLIKSLRITNGDGSPKKKAILLDAGIHALEWISISAVLYVIEQLVEHRDANADLLKDHEWFILPVVNPDGYEYTQTSASARMWRKTRQVYANSTCIGTDANRNFDFHWNVDPTSLDPCSDRYAGPKPFSEPEAVVLRDLMQTLKGRGVMYLSLHSFGNFLLYPWGWTIELPETWQDLDEVARAGSDAIFEATGTQYVYGSAANVFYIASGPSDYVFNAGFPIVYIMELPGGSTSNVDPPAAEIDGIVKETWIGIRAMAKRVAEKY